MRHGARVHDNALEQKSLKKITAQKNYKQWLYDFRLITCQYLRGIKGLIYTYFQKIYSQRKKGRPEALFYWLYLEYTILQNLDKIYTFN